MSGSVILTGANRSVGLHAAERVLRRYADVTATFTVRDTADTDVNMSDLRRVTSKFPDSKVPINEVDLADSAAVHKFATALSDKVAGGTYSPLKAIICNSSYWNLVFDRQIAVNDFDKNMQVSFVSHALLISRLIDKFDQEGCKVELVSSVARYRLKTPMPQYIPGITSNLDELVRPPADKDTRSYGMLRYSICKLVSTIWCYALNRHL